MAEVKFNWKMFFLQLGVFVFAAFMSMYGGEVYDALNESTDEGVNILKDIVVGKWVKWGGGIFFLILTGIFAKKGSESGKYGPAVISFILAISSFAAPNIIKSMGSK